MSIHCTQSQAAPLFVSVICVSTCVLVFVIVFERELRICFCISKEVNFIGSAYRVTTLHSIASWINLCICQFIGYEYQFCGPKIYFKWDVVILDYDGERGGKL